MQTSKEDLQKYLAFKKMIDGSIIELKGEAVVLAASLKLWFDGLEARFSEKAKDKIASKPVKQPIKKV